MDGRWAWLTAIEDGFSRLVMGWALSLQPSSAEVLVAMPEAIVIEIQRGPWGCVPQLIRFDGGREFLALAVAAEDPEQAYIRRCGAELALICDQIPIPLVSPLALRPRFLTTEDIDAIRAPTDPTAWGCQLAKRITGLPDGLVALIGVDQITDTAILGCLVPEPLRAILRAVDDRCEPVLQVPDKTAPEPISDMTPPEEEFAMALGSLLHGCNAGIRARKLPPQLRSRFEALRAESSTEATARTAPATSRSPAASHGPNRRSEATDIRVSRSTATRWVCPQATARRQAARLLLCCLQDRGTRRASDRRAWRGSARRRGAAFSRVGVSRRDGR